jgi:hypothetical protein
LRERTLSRYRAQLTVFLLSMVSVHYVYFSTEAFRKHTSGNRNVEGNKSQRRQALFSCNYNFNELFDWGIAYRKFLNQISLYFFAVCIGCYLRVTLLLMRS